MNDTVIEAKALAKTYYDGSSTIKVLRDIHLTIRKGDSIAIIGPSGSGKSTLLHLLGGLDSPSSGSVCMQGIDLATLSEKERCRMRNAQLGFIYQFHHLLPEFSALENVALPLLLAKNTILEARKKANALLQKVGLGHRVNHKPQELSGGERQRVAIARALVHKPQVVLADEPTGNLDTATANSVFALMLALNQEFQTSLVIVTHDADLASRMAKVVTIRDGQLS